MKRIETERLVLKPLTRADAPAAYVWLSDPEVNRYMIYPLYHSVEEAEEWIASVKDEENVFGIFLQNGTLIGSGHICPAEEHAWVVGYNLRRDAWGKGYATEAVRGMIKWAHENFGVNEFVSSHAVENIGSKRVQEKCGFQIEGYKEYQKSDGSQTFHAALTRLKL